LGGGGKGNYLKKQFLFAILGDDFSFVPYFFEMSLFKKIRDNLQH